MDSNTIMMGNHALECQIRQVSIRRIKSQDDAAIASLAEKYQALDLDAIGTDDSVSAIYSKERSAYFVMERGTCIVGGAGIAPLANDLDHIAELQCMVILPMSRRIGEGLRLLSHCLDAADLMGYRTCYAEAYSGDADLNEILRRAGFRVFSSPLLRAATPGCDAVHYLKLGLR
jgi:putative acetyltransferase